MKAVTDQQVETLATVVSDVLEASAFSFADPCEKDELPEAHGEILQAEITFRDDVQEGTIRLAAPAELAATFSAEMLALDPDEVTESLSADALKELLNVICGQLITAVWGEEPLFQLTVPRLSGLDEEAWRKFCERTEVLTLVVDDIPLACELGLRGREKP